ncbi:putative cysteine-rich receptor-like protein kinase 9 [Medicago truncatula]|uniref:putative cysteine-rich receptor-like protein kinase 9 n=1 Tax=Medicago truncatula TaxID=3880 RepID=UPI00196770E0|nr:putative cysteine-rich receptor-like protein kinase 9 [Medicago truncatula]
MAYSKILFFSILIRFLCFATIKAEDSTFLYSFCSSNLTTTNSTYQINTRTLLSSLSSEATVNTEFYNTTVTGVNRTDSVYGLFMCRGDVSSQICVECIVHATKKLSLDCPLSKQAVIYYDECNVRYSYNYFFSTVDTSPMYRDINITYTDQNLYIMTLLNQFSKLAYETGYSVERYMTNSLKLYDEQNLYSLGQCTRDLSSEDCTSCLKDVINRAIPWSKLSNVRGRIIYPSCNLRFELFQFYMEGDEALPPGSPSPLPENAGKVCIDYY